MADIPASAKRPADRKPKAKGFRVEHIDIPMDDEAAQAYVDAVKALSQARQEAQESRDRRVGEEVSRRRQPGAVVSVESVQDAVDVAIANDLAELEAQVDSARQAVEETTERFVFRALKGKEYRDLLAAHPPQDEDHEDVKALGIGTSAAYHAITFAPALVLASCVEPALDEEYVAEIFGEGNWNRAEQIMVFQTALAANTQRRVLPG